MEQLLICLSAALIAGLLMSRLAKAIHLPAVTSYLLAGLLLGPFFLGRLGLSDFGIGFGTLEQVDSLSLITQVALGFIAFVIGNEFRLTTLESMGRQAITVGILQAVVTTALVDLALVVLHLLRPDVISMASAITLGAIAAATAPAATLMVVKQYKANGPLTHLLLMVVAIDDAVGLVLFSASFGVANALEQGRIDPLGVIVEPLVEIVLSLGLGALAGFVLNQLEIYFHSRSKRMSLSVAFVLLTVGLSMVTFQIGPVHCSFSLLLVCMMTGTVFCNICPTSDELMDRLDRWVSPVNILFFVLSGAELDLNILANPMALLIGAVYIASRSLGKISGSYVSCKATRCSEKIQKYLGITLLPQAGVALGMAAEAAELSDGHMVRNVVLFSVLVYELVGPTLAKISLTAAGEIIPEGRTSTYLFINDEKGDMLLAVSDMDIYRHLTPQLLSQRQKLLSGSQVLVIDTNIPAESIAYLAENCPVPIFADPVSTAKAVKLQPVLGRLHTLKPNRIEAELLSGVAITDEASLRAAADALLATGLHRVFISLGGDGVFAADRAVAEYAVLNNRVITF